jgi:hypothetical protein
LWQATSGDVALFPVHGADSVEHGDYLTDGTRMVEVLEVAREEGGRIEFLVEDTVAEYARFRISLDEAQRRWRRVVRVFDRERTS